MAKHRKNDKIAEICIAVLCIATILVIGVGVMRDNKIQQEQSKVADVLNKQTEVKGKQEDAQALKSYDGLILSTFGDSVTSQGLWQPLIVSELGFSKLNIYGVGGTAVSNYGATPMCSDDRINAISKDSDVILFMGGTNDWEKNVPLGKIDSTDTMTFYGALNVVYDKLVSKFPNTKIIFMSTTFAMIPNGFNNKIGLINNIGLSNIDYGKAVGDVANAKKIPFIDLTNGWNKDNISQYVKNDAGFLVHPNAEGAKKMVQIIIPRLREIKSSK